jgi:hypothetical protein
MPKVEILINVIDADAVRKLRALRQTARDSFQGVRTAGKEAHFEPPEGVNKFRESLHVLRPLLHSFGVEVGGLREYGAVAGAGMLALAGVLGVTLAAALEKVAEGAAKAKRALADIGVSPEGVEKSAKELNETLETVGGRVGKLREATQPKESIVGPNQVYHPTAGMAPEELPAAEKQLEKVFRVGSPDETTAGKELDKFLEPFTKEKGLTPEIARALPAGVAKTFGEAVGVKIDEKSRLSPQKQLARSVESKGVDFANQQIGFGAKPEQFNQLVKEGAYIPGAELLRGIQQPKNAAGTDKQYAELQAKGVQSLDDAVGHVKASLTSLAEAIGGVPIKDAVQGLADAIKGAAEAITGNPLFQFLTGRNDKGEKLKPGEQSTAPDRVRQSVVDYLKPQVPGSFADKAFTPVIESLFGPEKPGSTSPLAATVPTSEVPGTPAYKAIAQAQAPSTPPPSGPALPSPLAAALANRTAIAPEAGTGTAPGSGPAPAAAQTTFGPAEPGKPALATIPLLPAGQTASSSSPATATDRVAALDPQNRAVFATLPRADLLARGFTPAEADELARSAPATPSPASASPSAPSSSPAPAAPPATPAASEPAPTAFPSPAATVPSPPAAAPPAAVPAPAEARGEDFYRQRIRENWLRTHPGEPLPAGYAEGGEVTGDTLDWTSVKAAAADGGEIAEKTPQFSGGGTAGDTEAAQAAEMVRVDMARGKEAAETAKHAAHGYDAGGEIADASAPSKLASVETTAAPAAPGFADGGAIGLPGFADGDQIDGDDPISRASRSAAAAAAAPGAIGAAETVAKVPVQGGQSVAERFGVVGSRAGTLDELKAEAAKSRSPTLNTAPANLESAYPRQAQPPGDPSTTEKQKETAAAERAEQQHQQRRIERWTSFLQGHFAGAGPFNPKASNLGAQMFVDRSQLIGGLRQARAAFSNAFGAGRRWSPAGGGTWSEGTSFARGGPIRGPGTSTSDSIVGEFERGGFILKASAALRAGRSKLDHLHSLAGMASGGKIMLRVSNGEEHFTSFETQRIGLANLQTLNRADGGPVSLTDEIPSPVPFPGKGDDSPATRESGYELHLHMPGGQAVPVSTDRDSLQRVERAAVFDRLLNIVPNPDSVR